MSNFIDLNQLQELLPQPDVTLEPQPTPTVSTTAPEVTTQPPPQTIPPPPLTQAPLPPIIVNVPQQQEKRRRDYPRSPYWQGYGGIYGGNGMYPIIGQTQGIGSDNSIRTGNITTTWQQGNVTQENKVQQQLETPQPQQQQPLPIMTPPPPAVATKSSNRTTKIIIGLCAAVLIGVLGYWAYKKYTSKTKSTNNKTINNANNNLFESLNNALNNTNNNALPRPPQ
jgi:hypothetical protein